MNKKTLINKFSESLKNKNGIFFIGSGISAPSGFPTWKNLIEPLIKDLNFEISDSDDLIEIAQYIVNEYSGNKGPLLSNLLSVFKTKKYPNYYHDILVRTNIKKIWTTNFDLLLEKAFNSFNIDIEVKTNDNDFLKDSTDKQVQIVKMHGCVDRNHNDIVFIQEDYEDFFITKPAIARQLQMDLLNNSFLFIGYNFGDANLKNILIETRRLSNRITRPHFLIQVKDLKNQKKQQLWCNNIKRFGIDTVLIDSHFELKSILENIAQKSKGKTVYITGSHINDSDQFAKKLGENLTTLEDLTILDGQSTGISRVCINSYSNKCLANNLDVNDKLMLYPNPYAINKDFSNKLELIPILKKWRNPIFRNCQIILVFDGGLGTEAELELANQFNTFIIPIPITYNDLAHKTLVKIKDKIDSNYYEKAFNCKLTVKDVTDYIKVILKE